MADPRFFKRAGPFTMGQLQKITGAELKCADDAERVIARVAPLQTADAECLSFLDNPKYIDAFTRTGAGACVTNRAIADKAPEGVALLLSDNPYYTYAIIAAMFYEADPAPEKTTIAPSAVVSETAKIGNRTNIEANAVISERAEIGDRCHIHPNVVIGPGVVIGNDCAIHSSVNISHSIIHNNVIIHHGSCIGQDGFGFATDSKGNHTKVPQIGRVIIEDNVEIGAGTCIDRGSGHDTVIGSGTKIDNLCQIGHNVNLGKGCILVSQVGLSGSTRVGDFVMFGGQAGVSGHLRIGDHAKIAAQSGVIKDIHPHSTVMGTPAIPSQQHHRQVVTLKKLSEKVSKDD
jgi:UDP-3-O-[3-hydroxymyristoyl] glucosamine N-acyltransferase